MLAPIPPVTARVTPEQHGERLDRAASALFALGISRTRLSEWIRAGRLRVDGAVVSRPGQPVATGQRLQLDPPAPEPLAAERTPVILYQDAWLAVLDKPAGLPMHPTATGDPRPSVARFLFERFGPGLPDGGAGERPGIVHRLDADTSGVCVVALESSAFAHLQRQFAQRTMAKEYHAVVYGSPRFQSDWIELPIGRDPQHPERMRPFRKLQDGAREALTYWELAQRFRGCARLRVLPRTGRTHQIRVHLAAVDLPLVGDRLYRARNFGPAMLPEGAPTPQRPMLHAYALELEHPARGERLRFEAALPPDMAALLTFLGERAALGDEPR